MPSNARAHRTHQAEVLIGRTLAVCLHPFAAWRSTMGAARLLLLAGYFFTGYLATLLVITALARS
jgi:hypothetical protein